MENDIRQKMYLKICYSILDWEWINEPNTFLIFIHLMLLANRKTRPYKGDFINRGEVLASYEFLAMHSGLSVQNVRTAIKHLEATGTITHRKIHKTNVFFIPSFEKHQESGKPYVNMQTGQEASNTAIYTD